MSDISHAGKKPYPGFSADGVTQELLRGLLGQVVHRGHGVSSLEINQSRLDVALGTLLQVALLGQGGPDGPGGPCPPPPACDSSAP